MLKILISTVTLTSLSFVASAAQVINFDMANDTKAYTGLLTKSEIQFIISNLPPSTRDLYKIDIGFKKSTIPPLIKPDPTPAQALVANHDCHSSGPENQKLFDDIYATTDPKVISSLYFLARTGADMDKYTKACLKQIKKEITYISPTIKVPDGYDTNITVEYGGDIKTQYNLTKETTTWLTHIGFTFTYNAGESYYSKGTTVDNVTSYTISEQNSQQDYLYSATALFTYPISRLFGSESAQWGWTAGLGASSDTISVLFGPSIIIKENVLINFGVSYQEFDELKGIYHEGMVLGSDPIDSSVLTSQHFKPSFAITVGFRFGE